MTNENFQLLTIGKQAKYTSKGFRTHIIILVPYMISHLIIHNVRQSCDHLTK